MKRTDRYGIRSLAKELPNEEACLSFVFDTLHSRECSCGGAYSPLFHTDPDGELVGRRKYQCSKCRFQIAPMAGTIFEKSVTPLKLWFHAILVFSNAKSGISAKELERELEVTYKTAYRMARAIREALPRDTEKLRGDVEVDMAYFGGRGHAGLNNEWLSSVMSKKMPVIVGIERGGRVRAEVVKNGKAETFRKFLYDNVEIKATSLMTDSATIYGRSALAYDRYSVNHSKGEFARDDIHINNTETFFAHLKRSIKGTFKVVSVRQLQSYIDAFVFHYNNRGSDRKRFEALLGAVLQPGA